MRAWLGAGPKKPPVSVTPDPDSIAALAGGQTTASPPPEKADPDTPRTIRVWRGWWPVLELIVTAGGVYRYAGGGMMGAGPPIGWDWPQVRCLADGLGLPWDRETLEGLKTAESEIVVVLGERWEKAVARAKTK